MSVGEERVKGWTTLRREHEHLYVVTRTDCVRDRLAHFYYWNDFGALNAAVGVAAADPSDIDLTAISEWTEREDPALRGKYDEFKRLLDFKR